MSTEPEQEGMPQQKLQALLQQYRECSAHHVCMYQLMWQVPTVTITASGLLVAATFGYDVPPAVRLAVTVLGAVFVFMMAVAIERNRMFQLRRRKDMLAIERELALVGLEPIAWEFAVTVKEAETGEFPSTGGLRLYRLDFFVILRTLMYALIVLLAGLSGLALADLLGAEVFD